MAEWLERLRTELGDPRLADDGRLELSPMEERLLLDLARVAAHASERIAAPLTTYLAGVALADLPPQERVARLQDLLERLDA